MKIHHIGYAVPSIKDAVAGFFNEGAGYEEASEIKCNRDRNIRVQFLKNAESGIIVELVEPMETDEGKPEVSSVLKRGKGYACPYHICYQVDDIQESVLEYLDKGFHQVSEIEDAPSIGESARVVFLIKKSVGIIELVEVKDSRTGY